MKESREQNTAITKCPHFPKLMKASPTISHFSFIKPSLKGWVCLKDGCIKKQGDYNSIRTGVSKYDADHKLFMEMNRFQIYCFECDLQITDEHQQLAYEIRKLALPVDKEQEKTLFGANIQYPVGFQKEKAGIAGTVGNQLSSYINSVIQLLAHLSPFYQICEATDLATIKDQCLRQTFICINKIRSGIFRIVETKSVEKSLLKQYPSFSKYSHKIPSFFIYEILRSFSFQFHYKGRFCENGQVLPVASKQATYPPDIYSPMKELFAGQFIWNLRCESCKKEKIKKAEFQCLRLELEDQASSRGTKVLEDLIQNIFNFSKLFQNTFNNEQLLACQQNENCKSFLPIEKKCFAKMPNILLLEFLDEDGLSLQYPDVLDLTKFTNSIEQQYKYSYIGSIEKNNKKYFTHVREIKAGIRREFIFEDSLIKQDASSRAGKAVVAIYQLEPKQKNKDLAKNIESSILVNVECYIPLPDFWNLYLSDNRRVQPLVNPFICPHGYLAPQVKSKAKNVSKIPPAVYQYLLEQFGGYDSKITKQDQYCEACIQRRKILNELKQSEKQMAKFADQLSSKKSKVCVDSKWFDKWKKYLYQNEQEYYGNETYQRPGPIDNKTGLLKNGEIDQSRYKKVSPEVWYFFKKFYGGGPLIAKNPLPPSLALTQAVDLRFEKIKNMMKEIQIER